MINKCFSITVALAMILFAGSSVANVSWDSIIPLSWDMAQTSSDDETVANWKKEASSAFEEAEKEILDIEPGPLPKPDPDPEKCICKGTGIITHGDGHTTPCPYHGENVPVRCKCDTDNTYCNCVATYGECSCEKNTISSKSVRATDTSNDDLFPFSPDKQMVWFTASWCPPCQQFKSEEVPKLEAVGWKIGKGNNTHIRIVDVDEHNDLYNKYAKGRNLPLFVLFVDEKEVDSIVGYTSANSIASMYNQEENT